MKLSVRRSLAAWSSAALVGTMLLVGSPATASDNIIDYNVDESGCNDGNGGGIYNNGGGGGGGSHHNPNIINND